MNRRPHRILRSAILLAALLAGSCSEDEDVEDNRSPVIHYLTSNRDTVFIPLEGEFNGLVTLTGAATDEDGDSLFWQWNGSHGSFPDGSSSHRIRWLAPSIARDYWIYAQVEDLRAVVRDSLRITVRAARPDPPAPPNESPVARFKVYPATGTTDTQFLLDATLSADPETASKLLEVRWDFDGDGIWDTEWSLNKRSTHRFPIRGHFPIGLQVRDPGGGNSTAARSVDVEYPPANPDIEEVLIPPGGDGAEEISYTVSLGRTEVTNAQFVEVMNWAYRSGIQEAYLTWYGIYDLLRIEAESEIGFDATTGGFHVKQREGVSYPSGSDPGSHPCTSASWYGAATFCDYLSMFMGLDPYYNGNFFRQDTAGEGYRLPTPGEWRHAARYPDQRMYPWGDESPDCERAQYNPWPVPCGPWTYPVAQHPAGDSHLGLSDLAGNAAEWTNSLERRDWWGGPDDPQSSGHTESAIVLGGGFNVSANWLTITAEDTQLAFFYQASYWESWFTEFYSNTGFRVCRTVP